MLQQHTPEGLWQWLYKEGRAQLQKERESARLAGEWGLRAWVETWLNVISFWHKLIIHASVLKKH